MSRSSWCVVSALLFTCHLTTVFGSENVTENIVPDDKGTNSRPKFIVCWENRVDAIVYLDNGQLYALKAGWAWQLVLDENGNLGLASKTLFRSAQLWKNLPEDFDFVITMPQLDNMLNSRIDAIPGKTIFGKLPNYYAYHNFEIWRNDTMLHWEMVHFADNRFTFTMHRTSLVLVSKMGFIPDGLRGIVSGHTFMFDCVHFPERIGFFEMALVGLPWLKLKQMIPIESESKDSNIYLAIFNYGAKGFYYCVFSVTRTGLGAPCSMRQISNAFSCPDRLMRFKSDNWAYTLFIHSGATLQQLIIFLIGALLGVIWILLFISTDSVKVYSSFYSGNVALIKKMEVEDE